MIVFKEKNKSDFPQEIFDNIFLNIEYHIRELGYGDIAVNKKMKLLLQIFYDILLKIKLPKSKNNRINRDMIGIYLMPQSEDKVQLIDDLAIYFEKFHNYCFELENNSMLKGKINFIY